MPIRRASCAFAHNGYSRQCNRKQPGGLSPLEKSDRKLAKCGGFIVFYEVRICCGKSERAPRFYFMSRSGIIA